MSYTPLNLRVFWFHSQAVAWIMLVLLLQVFVPAMSLAQEPSAKVSETAMITTIQQLLQQLGYTPGPVDGVMGQATRTAIRRFQQDYNLPVDGASSPKLLEFLKKVKSEQETELSKMSPNQIYIRAVELETQGNPEQASVYYKYLMENYPDDDVTVRAADRYSQRALPTTSPPTTSPLTPKPKSRKLSPSRQTLLGVGALAAVGVVALTLNDDENTEPKLGTWRAIIDFGCNGRRSYRLWNIRSDNTFTCLDCNDYGTWDVKGDQISIVSSTGDRIRYTGTVASSKDRMEGSLVDLGGETGCWEATYL